MCFTGITKFLVYSTKSLFRGDSLREIPFSHGTFLRHNGARERSIIQFTDLLSYWLSLRVIRGTDSSGKQFLDIEFIFYIFVNKYLDDRSGEQYYSSIPPPFLHMLCTVQHSCTVQPQSTQSCNCCFLAYIQS
jgi:hypothetical protein